MKQEIAEQARVYLFKIANLEDSLKRLREERAAQMTGLDPNTPGARGHMIETLQNEWHILGESFAAYFKAAMDSAIKHTETQLNKCRRALEEL